MSKNKTESPARDGLNPVDGLIDPYNIEGLGQEVGKLGFRLLFYPQIPTTMAIINEQAFINEQALTGNTSPLIALTDHQTQGIGRDPTKIWYDIEGASILLSALFTTDQSTTAEFTDIVALRVCMALRQQGADVLIKAPNDIVSAATGEKVSGILVQNIYGETNQYIGTNVGIGVNVHYTKPQLDEYPTDYGATSLDLLSGGTTNRQQTLIGILEAIATAEPEARVINHTPSVRNRQDALWVEHSFLLGKHVSVVGDGLSIQGKVVGTQIGRGIVIETADSKRHGILVFESDTKVRLTN